MSQVNIYVMDRGWVLVGRVAACQPNPLFVVLDAAAVIRRWGTQTGLGQLAREGPLEGTILDVEPGGTAVRLTACLRIIPCDVNSWESAL